MYSKRPVKSETRQYSKSDDVMLYGRIMLPDQEYVKQAINYEESDEWGEASLAWSKASRHFSITNPELAKVAELYRLRVNLIDAEREKPEEAMRILKNIKNTLDDIGIELPEHDIVIQKEQVFIESEIAEVKTETGWGKPINNYLPLVTLDMTERDQLSGKEGTGEIPVRIGLFGENGSEISSCAGFATFQYTAYEGQRKCCVNDCLIETLRATVGNKLRISYLNTQDRELNYYDQIFLTFRSKIIQAKRIGAKEDKLLEETVMGLRLPITYDYEVVYSNPVHLGSSYPLELKISCNFPHEELIIRPRGINLSIEPAEKKIIVGREPSAICFIISPQQVGNQVVEIELERKGFLIDWKEIAFQVQQNYHLQLKESDQKWINVATVLVPIVTAIITASIELQ